MPGLDDFLDSGYYGVDANGNPVTGPGSGGGTPSNTTTPTQPQNCPPGQVWSSRVNQCVQNLRGWCNEGETWDGTKCNPLNAPQAPPVPAPPPPPPTTFTTTTTPPVGTGPQPNVGPPLPGWAQENWNNPAMNADPKYSFGHALTGLDPTFANLQKVGTQFGYQTMGPDLIQLPGGQWVDAINQTSGSSPYWQFLSDEPGTPGMVSPTDPGFVGIGQPLRGQNPADITQFLGGGEKAAPSLRLPEPAPIRYEAMGMAPRSGSQYPWVSTTDYPFVQPRPFEAFRPFEYSPIPNYEPSPLRRSSEARMQEMLDTTSLSPEVVAKMKEGQKGSILSMAEQLKQKLMESASERGVVGGGATGVGLSDINQRALGDISSGYRDIDIQKAIQDRIDQQNAVGLANTYQQQLLQEFLNIQMLISIIRNNSRQFTIFIPIQFKNEHSD